MKDSQKQEMLTSKGLSPLTDYHWQRSQEAQKAVEKMSKHPLSSQQIKEQIQAAIKVNQRRK